MFFNGYSYNIQLLDGWRRQDLIKISNEKISLLWLTFQILTDVLLWNDFFIWTAFKYHDYQLQFLQCISIVTFECIL